MMPLRWNGLSTRGVARVRDHYFAPSRRSDISHAFHFGLIMGVGSPGSSPTPGQFGMTGTSICYQSVTFHFVLVLPKGNASLILFRLFRLLSSWPSVRPVPSRSLSQRPSKPRRD